MGTALFPERSGKIRTGSHPVNGCPGGEDGARPGGVLGDLRLERVETGKFLLGPDEIDERDPKMAAIEVDIDVEQMGFQPRHEASYRRAQADIGDPRNRP